MELNTSRNCYIVSGEKKAVIDVTPEFIGECENADYIVFTHTTPDIAPFFEKIKKKTIVGTTAAVKNLHEILNAEFEYIVVKNGASLDLIGEELQFFITPNIGQPDTMVVHEKNGGRIFTGRLYSDNGSSEVYDKYFRMYEPYIRAAQETVQSLGKGEICPCMGACYASVDECAYEFSQKSEGITASVYYYSVYDSTEKIAQALCRGLENAGVKAALFNAEKCDEKVLQDGLSADILMFGSATVNRNAAPCIWKLISMVDTVNARSKTGLAFGSYGWSGEAVKLIESLMRTARLKVFPEPQSVLYTPTEDMLTAAENTAERLAKSVAEDKIRLDNLSKKDYTI